jgi:hypothetical protein
MIHGESMIAPITTVAEMQQVAAWLAARSATAISDKQDVVDPVYMLPEMPEIRLN